MAYNSVRNLPDGYVQFELICRHVPTQDLSARDRKKLLAEILFKERIKPKVKLNSYLSPQVDCAEIQRLFKKLKGDAEISDASGKEVILDCLNFLRARVGRVFTMDPLLQVLLVDMGNQIDALEQVLGDTVVELGHDVSELSFSVEMDSANDLLLTNKPSISPTVIRPFSAPSTSAGQTAQKDRLKVPVHKWGIKFSGGKNGLKPMEFVNRVIENQTSKHVSDAELFSSFSDLLEGAAYTWYRSLRNMGQNAPQTWAELRNCLLQDFEKNMPEYMNELEHSIRECYQRDFGSVIEFFASIEEKFVQLSNFKSTPQGEQIGIIRRNLRPEFKSALTFQVFSTVGELKQACKRIEEVQSQNFLSGIDEAPVTLRNDASGGVKFQPSNSGSNSNRFSPREVKTNESSGQLGSGSKLTTPNPFSRQLLSDNRRNQDALAPQAPNDRFRHIICFGCGKAGHYKNKCTESGNDSGSLQVGSSETPVGPMDPQ